MATRPFVQKLRKLVVSNNKKSLISTGIHDLFVRTFSRIRLSSAPFISGDTFRRHAKIRIDDASPTSLEKLNLLVDPTRKISQSPQYVYISLSGIDQPSEQESLLRKLSTIDHRFLSRAVFIFHNADKVPPPDFYASVAGLGPRCFSVNVLDDHGGVCPIPLGLENRWRRKNGVIRHFPTRQQTIESHASHRPISLFGAFNVGTNEIERTVAKRAIEKYGHVFETRLTPKTYRQKLSQTLFVISPPGNGIDCHRTWEAIYFGAIPVIKKGFLATSLVRLLPIHEVEDWEVFCSLSRNDFEILYQDLIRRTLDAAYFEYWIDKMKSAFSQSD